MINGIVEFIPPDKCDRQLCRDIRPMKKKQFDSFTGLDEPALKSLLRRWKRMSWTNALIETYDNYYGGALLEDSHPLVPVGFIEKRLEFALI